MKQHTHFRSFLALPLLALCGAMLHSADLTGDTLVTSAGPLGGVNTASEVRLSGGGGAFAQRVLVGIAGNSTPSIFYGSAPVTTPSNSTSIGGGFIRTSGDVSVGASITMTNASGIYFKNAVGTLRQWAQWYSDNNVYYTNQDGAHVFRTGAGAAQVMRLGPGSTEMLRLDGNARIQSNQSTTPDLIVAGMGTSQGWIGFGGTNDYGIQGGADYLGFQFRTNGTVAAKITATGETILLGAIPTAINPGEVRIGGGRVMVGGTLSAKEIRVTTTGADYVFASDYKLRSLAEVEQYIAKEKHLPDMMSAKEMQANGMPVSEVVTKQLAKIEELTLYSIAAEHRVLAVEKRADDLAHENKQLKDRLAEIERRLGLATTDP